MWTRQVSPLFFQWSKSTAGVLLVRYFSIQAYLNLGLAGGPESFLSGHEQSFPPAKLWQKLIK